MKLKDTFDIGAKRVRAFTTLRLDAVIDRMMFCLNTEQLQYT